MLPFQYRTLVYVLYAPDFFIHLRSRGSLSLCQAKGSKGTEQPPRCVSQEQAIWLAEGPSTTLTVFKPPFLCTLSEGPTFFSFLSTYHDARINVCVRTSVHRKGADFFKEPYTVFRSGINLKYKKKSFFSSSLSCTRTMKVQDRFAQRIIISQTCPPRCPCVDGNEIGN